MAGENLGDNKTFRGAMCESRKVEFRNWYLRKYFDIKTLTLYGTIITSGILVTGVILLIGGLV